MYTKYYKVKLKHLPFNENGKNKSQSEILVSVDSLEEKQFSLVENKILDWCKKEDFYKHPKVVGIIPTQISDVYEAEIKEGEEKHFIVKYSTTILDNDNMKEVQKAKQALVISSCPKQAEKIFSHNSDLDIAKITAIIETQISESI
jgi:hypothetical protein